MADEKNFDELEMELIPFVDDEGNEFEMECVYVFNHKDKDYALLAEVHDHEAHEHAEGEECDCEEAFYIFEINEDEEGVEYIAVEDDKLLDELVLVIEDLGIFEEDDEDDKN